MTTWSLTHNDAKPACSSRAAISGMPSSRAISPLFGTDAPIRTLLRARSERGLTGIPEDLNVRRENGGADNEHTADASPAGRYFVVNLTRDEAGVAVADEARDTDF